jgi:hypothetical protein
MEQHEIESAFHAADALSSAGNNDGAIDKIREVLKEHPEDEHVLTKP